MVKIAKYDDSYDSEIYGQPEEGGIGGQAAQVIAEAVEHASRFLYYPKESKLKRIWSKIKRFFKKPKICTENLPLRYFHHPPTNPIRVGQHVRLRAESITAHIGERLKIGANGMLCHINCGEEVPQQMFTVLQGVVNANWVMVGMVKANNKYTKIKIFGCLADGTRISVELSQDEDYGPTYTDTFPEITSLSELQKKAEEIRLNFEIANLEPVDPKWLFDRNSEKYNKIMDKEIPIELIKRCPYCDGKMEEMDFVDGRGYLCTDVQCEGSGKEAEKGLEILL